jgi:hypothetical protein
VATNALDAALELLYRDAPETPSNPGAAAHAVDLERARRAGGVLLQALQRGALNDGAMASLAAALAAHPAAARVVQVQTAIADFDFDLAITHLKTVLTALGAPDSISVDATEPTHDELHEPSA